MSQQFDNTNRGVLFKNDEKKADNHPDYRGKINVNGTDFWLSAWIKEAKDKRKFMSLSVSPIEDKPQAKKGKIEEMDSDLPF